MKFKTIKTVSGCAFLHTSVRYFVPHVLRYIVLSPRSFGMLKTSPDAVLRQRKIGHVKNERSLRKCDGGIEKS